MRLKNFLLIIIVFSFLSNVNAQDFNDYANLKIKTQVSSSLLLERGVSSSLDYVYVNLTFIPEKNEFQDVTYNILTDPQAQETLNKNNVYLRWNNPQEDELKFTVNAESETKTNFFHITTKVKFPIEDDLSKFQEYLDETETVTSKDPDIIAKANELAQGEDDLFVLVHKIGDWTKTNINYSLETLTAEVSQDASWVLDNKKGVCDELTSLFVAMLRSLNIPARFVTGQSYTNIIDDFGNHAWAEVYFPGYGWIPFDPTYGQLGYVDATHLKMKTSSDVKESDIFYGWRANNVDLSFSGLNVKSNVINRGELYRENVELKLELLRNDVGPDSYVPVKVTAKNLNNYYLPLSMHISKAPMRIEDSLREVLLKPDNEKSVFYIVKTPKNVNPRFIYSSEIAVKDNFNNEASGILRFTSDGKKYSLEEAQKLVNEFMKEEEKVYSRNVGLKCSLDKNYYYDYDTGKISCEIINRGNVVLHDLEICYDEKCKTVSLNIVERKNLEFNFNPNAKYQLITVTNNEINKVAVLNPIIYQTPDLILNILEYPTDANYFDTVNLKIDLSVNSEIENVKVILNNKNLFYLESFSNKKDFEISVRGYNLKELNKISVIYEDKNGKEYKAEKEFASNVNKPLYMKYAGIIIALLIILIISMISRRKRPRPPYFHRRSIYL